MIKKWKNSNELTKETVIEYLQSIYEIYQTNHDDTNNNNKEIIEIEDILEEIQYIGSHFEEMKEEIKKLPEEEMFYIIRNKDFQIKTEDTIWKIIKESLHSHLLFV